MRLFAGDRIYRILDRLGPTGDEGEEEPIEAKMLSKQIESAQRKVEEQNFLIRKRVLEYDDVMNQQREIVYQYRDEVLEGRDMGPVAREQIAEVIEPPGRRVHARRLHRGVGPRGAVGAARPDLPGRLRRRRDRPRDDRPRRSSSGCSIEDALKLYDEREEELGEELMRALERYLLLQIIDQRWREHLYDMDYLREGIHLRGFAQIEPLVAYKNEAFTLFQDLMNTIWSDFARMIYNVEVEIEGPRTATPARCRRAAPAAAAPRRARSTRAARSRTSRAPTAASRPTARRRRRGAAGRGAAAPRRRARAASAATTRAGAGRARSSRSATGPEAPPTLPRSSLRDA